MPHACISGGSGALCDHVGRAGTGKRRQVCLGSQRIAFGGPLGWALVGQLHMKGGWGVD